MESDQHPIAGFATEKEARDYIKKSRDSDRFFNGHAREIPFGKKAYELI